MRYLKGVILVLIATVLCSCSLPLNIQISNIAKIPITIFFDKKTLVVEPNRSLTIKEIDYKKIQIKINDTLHNYDFSDADIDYDVTVIEGVFKKTLNLYAQIDSTGTIWAIDPKGGNRHGVIIKPSGS
jgi:hypothetical protein